MTDMDRRPDEDELFSSLTGMRMRDALLGEDSGRGALGDLFADSMLVRDIADGRDVRDALMSQRFWDSLEEERLAGAALDVFRTEPLPDSSPLWHTKNLLITPHVAGNMTLRHTIDRNTEMFCEDLENYRAGRPLRHLVDRALGY